MFALIQDMRVRESDGRGEYIAELRIVADARGLDFIESLMLDRMDLTRASFRSDSERASFRSDSEMMMRQLAAVPFAPPSLSFSKSTFKEPAKEPEKPKVLTRADAICEELFGKEEG